MSDVYDRNWRLLMTERMGGVEFDKPGSGYSFGVVLDEERKLAEQNVPGDPRSALLAFSIADPTWKMPNEAWQAGQAYYYLNPHSTRYTDNFGVNICPEAGIVENTHAQLANFLNLRYGLSGSGITFTPDWVQYSPGSIKRALAEFLPSALFDEKSVLVFPTPGYGVIKDPKNSRGQEVVDVPLIFRDGKWDIDYARLSEIAVAAKMQGAKVFVYLNVPHNPTGFAYGYKRWLEVLAWARDNNVTLIVDEAYTDLRFGESCSVLCVPGWNEHCIVLQSVSKGWNATGLRFGWMVAHPTMIRAIRQVTDVKDSGAFGPVIAMGLGCLRYPNYTTETCRRYRELHEQLAEGLRSVRFDAQVPDAGLCQFMPAPVSVKDVKFATAADCAKWLRAGPRVSVMHYQIGQTPWLRWAVTLRPVPECGLYTERSVIAEAVHRLGDIM